MKTNKILALALGLVSVLFINSCVEDDDYSTPDLTVNPIDESTLGLFTSFSNIVARYDEALLDGDNVGVFSVENDVPLYTIGYVVSDDSAGNFYEEVIIQNSPNDTDPATDVRRGLKLEINQGDLGGYYNFGRKVYIKLNGLAISLENGVYALGRAEGNSSVQIEDPEYIDFILRSPEVATIVPKMVAIEDLTEADENTYIQLSNSQVIKAQKDLTYAGESGDQFDGSRTITNCDTNATITLQTSTFSNFKSAQLPQGKGTIKGIFTRDFGDDTNVLVVNSIEDINFEDPNRCDPIELDCGLASTEGTNNLFSDDFETQSTNALISGNGWTNYIQAGSEGWEAYSAGGTNSSLGVSARLSAYNSGDASNIGWLITPAIDFDAQENETLVFKTSNSFSDNSTMEIMFSSDWDGTEANITSATWGVLTAAYIVQDDDFYGSWFDSGIVDLSCAEGTMHIAFKYTGGDQNDFTGTYELDEISVDYTP